jgi:hypothetical protein
VPPNLMPKNKRQNAIAIIKMFKFRGTPNQTLEKELGWGQGTISSFINGDENRLIKMERWEQLQAHAKARFPSEVLESLTLKKRNEVAEPRAEPEPSPTPTDDVFRAVAATLANAEAELRAVKLPRILADLLEREVISYIETARRSLDGSAEGGADAQGQSGSREFRAEGQGAL